MEQRRKRCHHTMMVLGNKISDPTPEGFGNQRNRQKYPPQSVYKVKTLMALPSNTHKGFTLDPSETA
ncbi:hypothetical protein CLNEO_18910 [Anaerotignum neopropionicum]|uniref:Uncharacterized protein n=1 Tax=Anaerotignum neopropionicum TaxID=36847 RepID=A0A136WEB3_9FIRM|nr:hypothetical protein [Anaerotignum neopropionicum]KXL52868.1 hypothetical protein CLNEO_18910 [Anaerotignum neopropionicum]